MLAFLIGLIAFLCNPDSNDTRLICIVVVIYLLARLANWLSGGLLAPPVKRPPKREELPSPSGILCDMVCAVLLEELPVANSDLPSPAGFVNYTFPTSKFDLLTREYFGFTYVDRKGSRITFNADENDRITKTISRVASLVAEKRKLDQEAKKQSAALKAISDWMGV